MKRLAKAAISLGALAFVLTRIDLAETTARVADLQLGSLVPALVAILAGFFIGAWKWQLLLRTLDGDIGFRRILRILWIGAFFNNLLPGRTGGDVYRSYAVSRTSSHRGVTALSVPVDRGLNLLALVAIALVAHMFAPSGFELATWELLWISCASVLIGWGLFAVLSRIGSRRAGKSHILSQVESLLSPYSGLLSNPRTIIPILALSVAYQIAAITANWCVARALGIEAAPVYFFAFIPLAAIASVIPVSINGFGIREGAYAVTFAQLGMSAGAAVSISLITIFLNIGVSLVGALLYVAEPPTRMANRLDTPRVVGESN